MNIQSVRTKKGENTCAESPVSEDEHARNVSGMFGNIVKWYDLLNRVLSLGLDQRWRRYLADSVLPEQHEGGWGKTGRILDLAAGTLDVSSALRRRYAGIQVPALDFCFPMLAHGKSKLTGDDLNAVWPVTADARALPLPDACVDGVTMAFGIRNIVPRSAAFAEMARVLVPGGRACILEFGTGKNRIWMGVYNVYLKYVLPLIGRLSGNAEAYRYLSKTIMDFPDADALKEEMRAAGFRRIYDIPLCSGIVCLHVAEK